ncbi:UvrD-helicase domain-containing protein [Paracoccus aerius]
MNEASLNQIAAADPNRSTWLTANAGSGKTRVLTDRVARLLLAGTAPERILCLTYTKAAATEMQNRLLRRLGQWAMLPEPQLRAELAELGEAEGPGSGPDLAEARRLFARAIETPGGLKVQTIHSFCAALLRRFPLEAGVPMGFRELDDRSAKVLRAQIVDQMADSDDPAIRDLTALVSGDDLDGFLAGLAEADYAREPDPAPIWHSLGLPAGLDHAALLDRIFDGTEGDLFDALVPILARSGAKDGKLAEHLARGNWRDPGLPDVHILCKCLLFGASAKVPFGPKIGDIPTKALRQGLCAPFMAQFEDLMQRVADARPLVLGLALAQKTLALHRFAHHFTRRVAIEKSAQGWLDFDDLIRRTAELLEESSMAQWVLWRLDGGIDHILVDEAQDTSPDQWRVIRRLTDEFTSGEGAHDRPRTLFVVGDPKQSIYSFQGADIAVFEAVRDRFRQDFEAVGQPMQQRGLPIPSGPRQRSCRWSIPSSRATRPRAWAIHPATSPFATACPAAWTSGRPCPNPKSPSVATGQPRRCACRKRRRHATGPRGGATGQGHHRHADQGRQDGPGPCHRAGRHPDPRAAAGGPVRRPDPRTEGGGPARGRRRPAEAGRRTGRARHHRDHVGGVHPRRRPVPGRDPPIAAVRAVRGRPLPPGRGPGPAISVGTAARLAAPSGLRVAERLDVLGR